MKHALSTDSRENQIGFLVSRFSFCKNNLKGLGHLAYVFLFELCAR